MKENTFYERALLTATMADLIIDDPDCLEEGISPRKLLNEIMSKENVNLSKKYLEAIVEREYANGGIVKLENGNLTLGNRTKMYDDSTAEAFDDSNNDSLYLKVLILYIIINSRSQHTQW